MTLTITHPKVNTVANWTQADLDAQIAAGNFATGTTLADITLAQDWNAAHALAGTIDDAQLANTAVTPGSYTLTSLTVDAKGRITAASSGSAGGTGTVTQVNSGAGLTGGPITTSGTLALDYTSANTFTGKQTFNTSSVQMGTLTASTALVSDASKNVISSATTATELGYVSGVTSAIQTQINTKQATGNYITALTGDVTATGPNSVTATLATVNANTGSFGSSTAIPNFTVNAKGLITAAGTNVVIAPAGTLTGATLNSTVTASSLTSLGTQAQALNMGSHLISSVTDPVSAQDAATKAYVDNAVTGLLDYRGSYNASTNLFPATGGSGLAGAILTGDFWICSVAGTLGGVAVTPGDLIIATTNTPGQTSTNWDLIAHDLGSYVTSVTGTTNRITSSGGSTPAIDISSSYVGQTSITTLGTVGTGTWQATAVAGQYGGTGVANTGKTITLGGNLTTSGAFATTLTSTATTNVTLPTTGTLATLAGSEALTNKSVNGVTLDATGSATNYLTQAGTYAPAGGGTGIPYAVAGGTANALTATFSPAITSLTDGLTVEVRATLANTSSTVTLQANATTASPVVRSDGSTLNVGDIAGATGASTTTYIYSTAVSSWVMQSPAKVSSAQIAGPLNVGAGGTGNASYTIGDTLYASGTGTLAPRAIGTATQVYTVAGGVPTWANPYAVKIATATASASTSLDFTGVTGYNTYMIVFKDLSVTAAATLQMLYSTNGGTSYITAASSYAYNSFNATATGTPAESGNGSGGATFISLVPATAPLNGANSYVNGTITFTGLGALSGDATYSFLGQTWNASTSLTYGVRSQGGKGASFGTGTVNAIRIQPSTSTFAAGTATLYGII